jgi:hypothetical protein
LIVRDEQEDRIIEAIDELAEYALSHGLIVVHRALTAAGALVREFAEDEGHTTIETGQWFGEALELLIAYARRRGWGEVQAKMAWDERGEDAPNGNILMFRRRSEQ